MSIALHSLASRRFGVVARAAVWLGLGLPSGLAALAACSVTEDDSSVSATFADATARDDAEAISIPQAPPSGSAATLPTDAGAGGVDDGAAPPKDASADTTSDASVVCSPTTCAAEGKNCGFIPDGCGHTLDCGACAVGSACGASGMENVCGAVCTPTTCAASGKNCGTISDGCGKTLACGSCAAGESCGASGVPNVCGSSCVTSCAAVGVTCGMRSNGCGQWLDCGTCTSSNAPFCVDGACRGADVCAGKTTPLGGCQQGSAICRDYANSIVAGTAASLAQACTAAHGTWLPGGCPRAGASGGCKAVWWSGGHCSEQVDWSYAATPPTCGVYAGNVQSTFVAP